MRSIKFKNETIIELADNMVLDFIGMSNTKGYFSDFCRERLKDVYQHEKLAYKRVPLSEYFDEIAKVAKQYTHLDWGGLKT